VSGSQSPDLAGQQILRALAGAQEGEALGPDPLAEVPWVSLRDLASMYFNTAVRQSPVLIAHEVLRDLYDPRCSAYRPVTCRLAGHPAVQIRVRGLLEEQDWVLRVQAEGSPPMVWQLVERALTPEAVLMRMPD
jgi:hypothetical protein